MSAVVAGLSTFGLAQSACAQAPTDPQIVGIVQTANRIDISQARLALRKSTNPRVKEFANQMISDHTNFEKSVSDLATKLGVKEENGGTAKQLKQQAGASRTITSIPH